VVVTQDLYNLFFSRSLKVNLGAFLFLIKGDQKMTTTCIEKPATIRFSIG